MQETANDARSVVVVDMESPHEGLVAEGTKAILCDEHRVDLLYRQSVPFTQELLATIRAHSLSIGPKPAIMLCLASAGI